MTAPLPVRGRRNPERGCSVAGCAGRHRALGYCNAHWNRFHRYGDPLGSLPNRGGQPKWRNSSRTITYRSWQSMWRRCQNPEDQSFKWYGARGIKVCARWADYDLFVDDMGERPRGTTLERNNPNGDYEPGNCRWASDVEQANNRRNTRRIDGMTLREISDRSGVSISTIRNHFRRGKDLRPLVADLRSQGGK